LSQKFYNKSESMVLPVATRMIIPNNQTPGRTNQS
jgi:hypothetical protein